MAQFGAEFEELNFEDTIEEESGGFSLLPDGDYEYTVSKVTRGRYDGSDKMPACNSVTVELTVWGADDKATVTERFFLVKKFEWKLSQFFLSLGLKKHGEPLRMRWNIEGMRGKCKLYVDTYRKQDGSEGKSNKVKKFYAYDEQVQTASAALQAQAPAAPRTQQGGWTPGAF